MSLTPTAAAPPLTPVVTRIEPESYLDVTGKPVRNVRVEYRVGPYGAPAIVLPADQFSADLVNATMASYAAEINKLPTYAKS